MATYADMVRDAVARHGPIGISELLDRMGVPKSKRGTRSSLRGAVYGALRTGTLVRDADGRLTVGCAARQTCTARASRTEERIRMLLSEGRAMTVTELADAAEVEPGTVRRHLRRMGATAEARGRTMHWSLPKGARR